MGILGRIERALEGAVDAVAPGAPPALVAALRSAVFPGGMRVRPRLCLAVAEACGGADPALADGAACAIELLHCASLVHDDLPCFDDADTRRGLPSVHQAHGQALAVLAGDGLIVLGFETLARAGAHSAHLAPLLLMLARASGAPHGLVAGQAWECEPHASLATYHRAKTASLFALATTAGALASGAPPEPWRLLGDSLGEAYQVADDIRDAALGSAELGKPAGRDLALGRPSAALRHGVGGALGRVEALVSGAINAIPPCRERAALRELILAEMRRLLPAELVMRAAA